ncbi:heavy metal-associated isoprenylated plant protein 39-like isoform X2 [Eucalyptus grandis]|uniref:heavy metal-associated isoprenylated plant protein 39-like isoform X2 n=1 Tax=Eucalyptus grandis TaxID=71139 RepID=UPI00192E8199|nr:heavy metal-associated isoprenylated plant protein 39-like isoform X2 [Eucalyptus grandis]
MKLVVKVELHDDRDRRKAMRVVSSFEGIGSLSMDSKDNKLTVSGDFDPVKVVNKLRKSWHTEIVSVGAGKEDDGKKDEGKKDEGKKEERKKDDQVANLVKAYQAYCSTPVTHYCVPPEGTLNCVIC